MVNFLNILHRLTLLLFITVLFLSCADSPKEKENVPETQNSAQETQSIIRTGVIDLKKIDSDENGTLYECPMDWNVISDKEGSCPVCEMKLKEFSVAQVKENLQKFGFQTAE